MLSIIIPYYNDISYITEAVKSAISQTVTEKEIIIVNDGSNDESTEFLKQFESDVIIVNQKNMGLSGARNAGIRKAKGKYIMLLDSDDKFEPAFAEKAISVLENNHKVGVVTCWGKRFTGNKILDEFKPQGGNIDNFIFRNAAIGTSMIRKICWEKVNGYDEQMKKGYEDWEFYIRVTQNWNVAVIPEFLFYYRQRPNSMRVEAVKKYDLSIKKYIFNKNKDIYIKKYDLITPYLLTEIDKLKQNNIKVRKTIDYKLGETMLAPIRFIKKLFK